ncbi:carbohydrate ABC transporter permease [Breznakiella homolactica]|uniref:Carbohydrate ABC transporter permease n=1 Tax=Breznakiella homolactica TaxID=2798577 RepID=A0A7T7XKR9_9SPIR|nr:carbohydrate ABC transporter permease [Breznakiella homolactica]QQO08110.1 carbohydrate ABC transporter permease [Breznakiella homolactica]
MKNSGLKKQAKLIPGYILVCAWVLFTFVLIGWIFRASLSTTAAIFSNTMSTSGIHFVNYWNALFHHNIAGYFVNSIIYTFSSVFLAVCICAPAAYGLSRFRFRGNKLLQSMFIAGLGIPTIMIIMPLFSLIASMKLTNNRFVLILLYIGVVLPFTTYYLMTFFRNLSHEYEDAAAIDGCGQVATFWRIMLPLAQPGIVTVVVFNFITIWNEFFISLIFANDTALRPVSVGLYSMVNSMRYVGDWAGMFAVVVIVFLPTFILYIALSEKIVSGVTSGGLKG